MIVLVTDHFGIATEKLERDSLITTNPNGPCAFSYAFERMKSKARKAHILWFGNRVQATQDQAQPLGVLRLNPGLGSRLKKLGQALVLEASNHGPECNL